MLQELIELLQKAQDAGQTSIALGSNLGLEVGDNFIKLLVLDTNMAVLTLRAVDAATDEICSNLYCETPTLAVLVDMRPARCLKKVDASDQNFMHVADTDTHPRFDANAALNNFRFLHGLNDTSSQRIESKRELSAPIPATDTDTKTKKLPSGFYRTSAESLLERLPQYSEVNVAVSLRVDSASGDEYMPVTKAALKRLLAAYDDDTEDFVANVERGILYLGTAKR
jgi:hypothetical protein